ncbi:geraniol 8-hydroxylase-like [Arachis stenosperma]|uniref:geraniol 8-hydroxylase-like n=1 Tax=Arachis stenosperma TaxID=217475 RepID=UPI0025AD98FA|nr:geraniol 8-hydroxylase-like [Arachis stenosperma]
MDFVSCTMIFVLTCVTMHALCLLFTKSTKPNYKLPPGPSRLPIIGNLLDMGEKPHLSLSKLTKIHGPIMSLQLGQKTSVVVSSAEMAKEILLTHDHLLSNRQIPQSVSVLNHEHYSFAFIPISPLWREMRKICNTQLLSHKNLDDSQQVRRKKMQQLLNDVHHSSQIGEAVDIGALGFKATINLLSNTIFSIDLIDSTDAAGEFKDLVTNITNLVGTPNLADFFPVLKMIDPQGINRRQAKNVTKVLDIFDRLINQRLKLREDGFHSKNDMLDSLLTISKDNKLIDKTLIAHLFHDIFVAGTDTTVSTLEWAMSELVRNPQVMEKAKEELGEIVGNNGSVPVEESDISKLPYLQAVIKETLRLHPPVPFLLPRKAEIDVDIGGYTIPKDAQVMVNVWNIGRDPSLWDNPTLFSPERFIGSDIDVKGTNFELVPFGAGRRICPGLQLANRMLYLMLGSLINSFDWKLQHGMRLEDIDMTEKFGITLQKAQPLKVFPINISN